MSRWTLSSSARRTSGWWLARAYAVLVLLAAMWAWYVGIQLLHAETEHLLPGIVLTIVALPTSLTVFWLGDKSTPWPLGELAWITVCGAVQAMLLCWLTRPHQMTRP